MHNSVRLACVKHAASVHPEPGSNSHVKVFSLFRTTLGCSSRFTVLGSFLFSETSYYYKEFSGFGSLFSYHCSLLFYQRQLLYLITFEEVCQQLFYFFLNLFFKAVSQELLESTLETLVDSRFLPPFPQRRILIYHILFDLSTCFFNFFYFFHNKISLPTSPIQFL